MWPARLDLSSLGYTQDLCTPFQISSERYERVLRVSALELPSATLDLNFDPTPPPSPNFNTPWEKHSIQCGRSGLMLPSQCAITQFIPRVSEVFQQLLSTGQDLSAKQTPAGGTRHSVLDEAHPCDTADVLGVNTLQCKRDTKQQQRGLLARFDEAG